MPHIERSAEERAEDLRQIARLERLERDAPVPVDHWQHDTLTFAPARRGNAR